MLSANHRVRIAVIAGGSIAALSLGVRSTFGVFLDPVVDGLSIDRGTFALAVAVQQLFWGLSQPIAGALADRYGSGRVLATGGLLYAAGMIAMSSASDGVLLTLSAGVLTGIAVGAAGFSVVLASVGRMVRPERRALALGVVSAIGSLGQFVLIPVARQLIDNGGWERTARVLGLIVLLVVVAARFLLGRSADFADSGVAAPEARPLRAELRRAAHAPGYRRLNAAFFVCGFHVTFIGTHLVSYVGDLRIRPEAADLALMLIGLFNVVGSLAAGWLGSRHSNTMLLAAIYGLRAVVIAAFLVVPASAGSVVVFGAAMGVLWLSTVPLTSGIVAAQFGTTHAGTLFGIVFLSHQFGAFAGAWLGGELADATGSYDIAWWIGVALGVVAMLFHIGLDEGPAPDPPEVGPVRLRPAAGIAAAGLTLGVAGAIAPALAAADDAAAGVSPVCALDLT